MHTHLHVALLHARTLGDRLPPETLPTGRPVLQRGGVDSPESNQSKLGDCADNDDSDHELPAQGQPLPARAEDEQMVQMRIAQEFVNRGKEEYKKDTELSTLLRDNKYERHADGLHWTKQGQLVIPDYGDLRVECVLAVHTHPYAGHYGINRTLKKAQQVYYWPQMRQTVETVVKECDSCQRVQYVRAFTNLRANCIRFKYRNVDGSLCLWI
jgi:hypothetical protein